MDLTNNHKTSEPERRTQNPKHSTHLKHNKPKSLTRFLLLLILFFGGVHLVAQPNFPDAGEVFRDDVVARVDIIINPDTLEWIYDNPWSNTEFHAVFVFSNGTVNDTVENVGFRLRGNTSRVAAKKSFKVSFNTFVSGRKFYGLEKMNLNGEHNDPVVSRSKVCWDLLRAFDIPAPRSNHVRVFINQEYYGLYVNVEHIDEEFVDSRFGNQDGNLYKCLWPADLDYLGTDPDLYKIQQGDRRVYALKTNKQQDDYSDLAHFIDVLNNTPVDELKCALQPVFNVEDYLKIMAVDVMTSNWDGYIFNKNNFYLYHNTESGKFEYIPYDLDNTFGIDWFGINWAERNVYEWSPGAGEERPLFDRLLQVDEFKDLYSWYLSLVATELMPPDTFFGYLDDIKEKIYPYLQNDPYYPLDYGFTVNDFLQSWETGIGGHVPFGLKDFTQERIASLNNQIQLTDIAPVVKYIGNNHPGPGGQLTIRAFVEDNDDGVTVGAKYSIDGGAFQIAAMYDDGEHADDAANDNIFGVMLGPFNTPLSLSYFIVAEDVTGKATLAPCEPVEVQISEAEQYRLFINEFMAKNTTVVADEYGEYDDWIELFNDDTVAVWLGDKYLTDDLDDPGKWRFPDYTIQPGEFLLVWADNDPEQGDFHATFKLSSAGEEIAVCDGESTGFAIIDAYGFGPQTEDVSEGRDPDAGENWIFYPHPTPGISNTLSNVEQGEGFQEPLIAYPNPLDGNTVFFNQKITGTLFSATGQKVLEFRSSDRLNIPVSGAGLWFLRTDDGRTIKIIIQ